MYIAFRKIDPHSFVDRAIGYFSGPRAIYCHSEILASDESWSFPVHASGGCEFKIHPKYYGSNWDLLWVDSDDRAARSFCEACKGDKYNRLAIAWMVIEHYTGFKKRPSRGSWWCSEQSAGCGTAASPPDGLKLHRDYLYKPQMLADAIFRRDPTARIGRVKHYLDYAGYQRRAPDQKPLI